MVRIHTNQAIPDPHIQAEFDQNRWRQTDGLLRLHAERQINRDLHYELCTELVQRIRGRNVDRRRVR